MPENCTDRWIGSRRRFLASGAAAVAMVCATPAMSWSDKGPPIFLAGRYQFTELEPVGNMPQTTLRGLDGRAATLAPSADRVTLVSFWATWCEACRTDLMLLDRARALLGDRVKLMTVATDREGSARVAPFVGSLGLDRLPVYLDPHARMARPVTFSDDRTTSFTLYAMPITFVVAPPGRIVGYIAGSADWTSQAGVSLIDFYARR